MLGRRGQLLRSAPTNSRSGAAGEQLQHDAHLHPGQRRPQKRMTLPNARWRAASTRWTSKVSGRNLAASRSAAASISSSASAGTSTPPIDAARVVMRRHATTLVEAQDLLDGVGISDGSAQIASHCSWCLSNRRTALVVRLWLSRGLRSQPVDHADDLVDGQRLGIVAEVDPDVVAGEVVTGGGDPVGAIAAVAPVPGHVAGDLDCSATDGRPQENAIRLPHQLLSDSVSLAGPDQGEDHLWPAAGR